MDIKKVCVVGAGNMGAGIAQVCAQVGFTVSMRDLTEELVNRGLANIRKTLEEGIKRGKVREEDMKNVLARIQGTTALDNAVKDADIVIEAIFEDMEIKKKLFAELEPLSSANTIFATNTSTLSITEMATVTNRADKFLGLHFFYPAAINRLIELIPGEKTSSATLFSMFGFARTLGKVPIQAKDSPGFAVNRYFVPFLNEACRMLDEKIADIPTIETAAKEAFGITMGPFELMNVTGIPIAYHSQETLYRAFGDFYKPADALKKQFEAKEKWSLTGEPDRTKIESVKNRFLGLIFGLTCQLVDESVATREDVDTGALIGLRWRHGPFAMMNSLGFEQCRELIKAFSAHYQREQKTLFPIPKSVKECAGLVELDGKLQWPLKKVKWLKYENVAVIYINRPEALNALNSQVLMDLNTVLMEIKNVPEIRVVIITGEGNAFVAGADIKEMLPKTPLAAREFTALGQKVFRNIETFDLPVIAAINGYALGGGLELAAACDIIIASEKARLGVPEVSLGLHPGFGGTQRLPRLIGRHHAKELIFRGNQIDAKEAERIGLVNRVVPANRLMDEAMSIAEEIASCAPIAVRLAKDAVNRGLETDVETGLAYEVGSISLLFSTEDRKEGLSAFIDKRRPKFSGK